MFEYNKAVKEKQVGAKTPEEQAQLEKARGWRWAQTADDVEVVVAVPSGTTSKVSCDHIPSTPTCIVSSDKLIACQDIAISFGSQSLKVALKPLPERPLIDFKLFAPIRIDECTWTLCDVDDSTREVQVNIPDHPFNSMSWKVVFLNLQFGFTDHDGQDGFGHMGCT